MTGNDLRDFIPPNLETRGEGSFSALTDRITCIEADKAAVPYLKQLGAVVCAEMVEEEIAAHALWLRETWKDPCPDKVSRFGATRDLEFMEALVGEQDAVNRLYMWIYSYVVARGFGSLQGMKSPPMLFDNDLFMAHAAYIHAQWKVYDPTSNALPVAAVSRALASVAPRRVNRTVSGRLASFRVLDVEAFKRWVERMNGDWPSVALEELREKSTALITSRH